MGWAGPPGPQDGKILNLIGTYVGFHKVRARRKTQKLLSTHGPPIDIAAPASRCVLAGVSCRSGIVTASKLSVKLDDQRHEIVFFARCSMKRPPRGPLCSTDVGVGKRRDIRMQGDEKAGTMLVETRQQPRAEHPSQVNRPLQVARAISTNGVVEIPGITQQDASDNDSS